ncbi:MAG: efflux RND transporter permease subunit [Candidatus Glassbacteria bacterium]|nr:efflux RND transporter permease subunit [Candidatus Glassbacteria bacterium]
MKLAQVSIKRPVTTIMGVLSIVVLGLLSVKRLPLVFFPDISSPYLRIHIPYQSSSPEEVEMLITRPVEEIMGTLPGLKAINSNSSSGYSSISLEFEEGRDMDLVSMEVRDRLDRVRLSLPSDMTDNPRIMRWQMTDMPIFQFGVIWKGDPDARDHIVEDVLEKRMIAIEGVANVETRGLDKKSIWIDLDQDLMRSYGINAYQLSGQVRADNADLPAGWVKAGGKKYNLRATGSFRSVEELDKLPLNSRGLRLNQVADVRYDYPKDRGFESLDGYDLVSMRIYKASNANIVEVCARVRAALDEIKTDPRYSELAYQVFWDQSQDILESIDNLKKNGLIGGLLAVAVLLFFLGKVRNTLVIAIAIPVSIICTFFFMYVSRLAPFNSELTLNIITLMALIYAIGIVVDPSIVVLENIFRIRSEKGLDPVEAANTGAGEVGMAVLASMLTNIIVFAPLIFLAGGGRGPMRFMKDFGITFCVVCLASLLVAITIVPLLSARVMKKMEPGKQRTFPRLRNFFVYLAERALHARIVTLVLVVFMLFGVFFLYKMIDKQGSPYTPERRMDVNIEISHNYTLEQSTRVMRQIESDLLSRKEELEIRSARVELRMGRSNRGEVQVYFEDLRKGGLTTLELQEKVKALLPEKPGFNYRYGHRHGRGGETSGLEIILKGEQMELLDRYARQVMDLVKGLDEVQDIDLSTEEGEQEVRIMVNRERAAATGISASQVARSVSAQLSSRPVSRYKAADREVDIQLGLAEEDRLDLSRLGTMEMFSPDGQRQELKSLADFQTGSGPRSIQRTDRLYNVSVYLNSRSSGIYLLSSQVAARMSQLSLAPGYTWELGRSFQYMRETESESHFAIILSLIMIYILLAALFESFIHPFTILLSVPFAIIGVAVIFVLTKTNLGAVEYIGVLIVCGLVVNNGIILIDCINQLRMRGLARQDAILEGVRQRLRPILMTAMTTILSLLPMAAPLLAPWLFGPAEGRAAMWGPVGLAILGGMTTSTFLTLVVTPTLYSLFDDLALGAKHTARRVFSPGKKPVVRAEAAGMTWTSGGN